MLAVLASPSGLYGIGAMWRRGDALWLSVFDCVLRGVVVVRQVNKLSSEMLSPRRARGLYMLYGRSFVWLD